MCLEIGNKVAVLDDVIKGYVIDIQKNNVAIKAEDGMIYLFKSSELVKIDKEQYKLSAFSIINEALLLQKKQENKKKKTAFKKRKKEVVMEVDLHIEKLTKSTRNMNNFDMLTLQMDTAKRKIEYCIDKKISKIIFIHGVGEGILKTELEFLLNKYPVKYYDASYKKYGLGATEVYIYQNS